MTLRKDREKRVLAIIPARGGSKGISKKNVRVLAGKPLLAYSIERALQTPSIHRVVVSTDDSEITDVSIEYGAEVIHRPPGISGDKASSESALLHVLDYLRDKEDYEPDLVVFLQATSPLRERNDIQKAIETLISKEGDSLFSACLIEGFVWQSKDEKITPLNYDPVSRPRRQELKETILEENGSIYIFRPWVLRQFNSRLGGKVVTYAMPRVNSFQLDKPSDLKLFERLFVFREKNKYLKMLEDIRLLVLDFDGVMTDNMVLVSQDGKEAVFCNRGDGWGIARVREIGIDVLVLSTETNPVIATRCRKLGVDCVQGCEDKLGALREVVERRSLTAEQVVYVGNDVNDLSCMNWAGVPIAVANAVSEVKAIAKLITTQVGGKGAVREVADWIISAKTLGR